MGNIVFANHVLAVVDQGTDKVPRLYSRKGNDDNDDGLVFWKMQAIENNSDMRNLYAEAVGLGFKDVKIPEPIYDYPVVMEEEFCRCVTAFARQIRFDLPKESWIIPEIPADFQAWGVANRKFLIIGGVYIGNGMQLTANITVVTSFMLSWSNQPLDTVRLWARKQVPYKIRNLLDKHYRAACKVIEDQLDAKEVEYLRQRRKVVAQKLGLPNPDGE